MVSLHAMIMGLHNRASGIGTEATNGHAFARMGDKRKTVKYTEEYVLRRARMIPFAIDARRQRYPHEAPYEYQGKYIGGDEWSDEAAPRSAGKATSTGNGTSRSRPSPVYRSVRAGVSGAPPICRSGYITTTGTARTAAAITRPCPIVAPQHEPRGGLTQL